MKWIFTCALALATLGTVTRAETETAAAAWTPGAGFRADTSGFSLDTPTAELDSGPGLATGFGDIHGFLWAAGNGVTAARDTVPPYTSPDMLSDGLFRNDRLKVRLRLVYPTMEVDRTAAAHFPPELGVAFRFRLD